MTDERPGATPPGPRPAGLTRAALLAEVTAALAVVPADATAIVAVSGGPDSSALAYLVAEARPDLHLTLAHVRHGLRDDRADLAVVEEHGTNLGVPVRTVEVTVDPSDVGPEAAARRARYAALRQVAVELGASHLLVGHSADDQAETVLLRLARGTGTPGLAAMRPLRAEVGEEGAVALVRPLLRLRRAELRRFLLQEGLTAADDPTNRDVAIPRVAARERLLPRLAELAADPVGALGRLADLAADDETVLGGLARDLAATAVRRAGPVLAVHERDLAGQPAATVRRLVRDLVVAVRGGGPPTATEVASILGLAAGEALDLAGVRVTSGGGWLAVAPIALPRAPATQLSVPGVTPWPPLGTALSARDRPTEPPHAGQLALDVGPWRPATATVPAAVVPPGGRPETCQVLLPADIGPLTVRTRRPGDRLRTAGGTRKVQDVLVDAGVPRPVRDLLPVLVAGDRLVWIAGIATDVEVATAGAAAPAIVIDLVPGDGAPA